MKEYDLICSLGGNCSAAHNLRFRNLRKFSLPFDWCYIVDETPIFKLAECFQSNSLLKIACKDNLLPLTDEEERSVMFHSDTVHYKDQYSGFYFVNHFHKTLQDGGYEEFRRSFEARLLRLAEYIEKSRNILFVLATAFEFDVSAVLQLQQVLIQKYPEKNIDFYIMMFNSSDDKTINENPSLVVNKYKRKQNVYDFSKTNFEWHFLDDIENSKLLPSGNYLSALEKLFIKTCPFKKFRKELRKIYGIGR